MLSPAALIPPLLAKELIELAAAKRTYVLRSLYALGMFGLFVAVFAKQFLAMQRGDIEVFGQGRVLFDSMVYWQFAGVYLFLPILVAPLIPVEEQRGNLDLLLVSGIRPGELLAQMLASRLLAMAGFLILALPIAGLAYALGGVSVDRIGAAAVCLAYACLQTGCLALWCSARERSPLRALIACLIGVPVLLGIIMPLALGLLKLLIRMTLFGSPLVWGSGEIYGLSCAPLWLFAGGPLGGGQATVLADLGLGLPCLATAGFFFWLAWRALRRRGSVMSKTMQEQMAIYRPERRYELHRRQRVVALGQDQGGLPKERPLAWRELRRIKRGLTGKEGRRAWFVAGLGGFVFISLFIMWVENFGRQDRDEVGMVIIAGVIKTVLFLALPPVAVLASGVISAERANSSLPLLLVSPLATGELLADKLAGVSRLCLVALALIGVSALLCAIATELSLPSLAFLAVAVVTAWLYLRLAVWIGLAVSLRLREPVAAAAAAVGLIVAWSVLPLVALQLARDLGWLRVHEGGLLSLLSPASLMLVDTHELLAGDEWPKLALLNTLLYACLLAALRWWTLRRADALLGRVA